MILFTQSLYWMTVEGKLQVWAFAAYVSRELWHFYQGFAISEVAAD